MENREITLADIFLDILSESQDKGAKLMAERIKAAIKSPEILELVNICVINALGYKSKISSKTVDNAIDSIVSFVHSEIDSSNLSDNDKEKEKNSYYSSSGILASNRRTDSYSLRQIHAQDIIYQNYSTINRQYM